MRAVRLLLAAAVAAGCAPDEAAGPDDGGTVEARDDGGEVRCDCTAGQVCVPDLGCRECWPGVPFCVGETQAWSCGPDGNRETQLDECVGDESCSSGSCVSPCAVAEGDPSNVGCHFFAVDLDSGVSPTEGLDACAEQFAVAVANLNPFEVRVQVFENLARFGEPVAESLVEEFVVPADDLLQINLPQREVDGAMGQNGSYRANGGSGTFVSSHAYRIEAEAPVVAYQFQPVVQTYSNDASILIPRQALGERYYVLSWPAAHHCSVPSLGPMGLPWRGMVTIVGIHEETRVTVVPSHPVEASAGDSGVEIAATPAGEPLEFVIGPYDVVNLESQVPVVAGPMGCVGVADQDGDFTGTRIEATRPVAVFAGVEAATGWTEGMVTPPGAEGATCCADHMEEQLFPVTALGWNFVVSRSPVRSRGGSWEEPDIYRILATVDGTEIFTSLPAPHDYFALDEGQWATFFTTQGFTVHSEGGAIMVGQYLAAAEQVLPELMGDPSFLVFPAAEQHRQEYVFLVPTTWEENHVALAMPVGTDVLLDGAAPPAGRCDRRAVGELEGTVYGQLSCELTEGVHRVEASAPVGLSVYGYFEAGSYAYPGGADVDIINPII